MQNNGLKYIDVPKEISINLILSKRSCLAPSKYHDFYPPTGVDFRILSTLIGSTSLRKNISKSQSYQYIEIRDIDVNTGFVATNPYKGYFLPSESSLDIQQHDILISKVRTYRKGIGMVETSEKDLTCTPAFFVIRDVSNEITKEYLLSILRSEFFIEQILSLQNRGMYPTLDADSADNVLIPIPKKKEILNYVSVLTRSIVNKYRLIYEKNETILELVRNEIKDNQKQNTFEYTLPSVSDLFNNGRIDAGFFSEDHKRSIFETQNYKNGFFTLNEAGFEMIPGPSLEIKLLGTRIDSKYPRKGFYRLVTPKQFTEFGTISYYAYLGTPRKINPIQYGDILFGESGTGRSLVYLETHDHTINNAHAHILRPIPGECSLERAITIRAIIAYYKSIGVIDHLTVGGSGGHLSPSYFDRVFIPDFPEKKQKEISSLYHNPTARIDTKYLSIDNYIETDDLFNSKAGITELDKSAKIIKEHLDVVIDKIVRNQKIEINFHFLN